MAPRDSSDCVEFKQLQRSWYSLTACLKQLQKAGPLPDKASFLITDINFKDSVVFIRDNLLPPVPRLHRLFENLACEVPLDKSECDICFEPYASPRTQRWAKRSGKVCDSPVRLKCGHVFGLACLLQWSYPFGPSTTCPLCRKRAYKTFSERAGSPDCFDLSTCEGALDEKAWAHFTDTAHLSKTQERRIASLRYELFVERFCTAKKKLTSQANAPEASLSHADVLLKLLPYTTCITALGPSLALNGSASIFTQVMNDPYQDQLLAIARVTLSKALQTFIRYGDSVEFHTHPPVILSPALFQVLNNFEQTISLSQSSRATDVRGQGNEYTSNSCRASTVSTVSVMSP